MVDGWSPGSPQGRGDTVVEGWSPGGVTACVPGRGKGNARGDAVVLPGSLVWFLAD